MSTPGKPDQPISGGSSELENRLRAQWAVKAWSFLTLDDTARLGPTEVAYPDELNVRYVYDSWVPHHADVAVGDLAVIRGRTLVLGTGRIDAIHTSTGYKVRQRCPECRSTDYKYRKTANVPFRCSTCASEFWETDKKDIGKVTIYAADYSATYRDADDYFLVADLTDVYLNRSGQQSIRPLDPAPGTYVFES